MKKANYSQAAAEAPETKCCLSLVKSLDQDLNLAVGILKGTEGDGKQSRKSGAVWGRTGSLWATVIHSLSSLEI